VQQTERRHRDEQAHREQDRDTTTSCIALSAGTADGSGTTTSTRMNEQEVRGAMCIMKRVVSRSDCCQEATGKRRRLVSGGDQLQKSINADGPVPVGRAVAEGCADNDSKQ
jgi:hypothetical protein